MKGPHPHLQSSQERRMDLGELVGFDFELNRIRATFNTLFVRVIRLFVISTTAIS